jgi:hypothetical protein
VRISNTDISRCLRPSRAYWLRVQDIVSHLIDACKSRSINLASSIHTHTRLTACRTQCARLGAPTATIVSSARREYSACLRLQRKIVTYLPRACMPLSRPNPRHNLLRLLRSSISQRETCTRWGQGKPDLLQPPPSG